VISGDPSRGNPPHSPKRLERATAASARRGPTSRRRRLPYHALTARAHRLSSTLRKPGTLRDQITAGICVGLDSGEDGTPSDRRIAKSACRFAASMRQHAIGCDDRSRQGGLAYRLQKNRKQPSLQESTYLFTALANSTSAPSPITLMMRP